jgi:alcohol dehydrogenase
MVATFRSVQVAEPGAALKVVDREEREPAPGQVRIAVEACGICHTAKIPGELSAVDAAPMACAGVTMFNSLRHSHAKPGDLVAVLGLGGLGHLGVQFAAKMGFRVVDGLAPNGELLALAVLADSLTVTPLQLIIGAKTVHGHPGGTAMDVEDTLNFAALHGIRPTVQELPLECAAEGYERMLANQARFRVVLTTGR